MCLFFFFFFFFKQKTAYEIYQCDWSSDVCYSDLVSFAGNEMNSVTPGTGTTVLSNDAKRIDVIVTDQLKSRMVFSAYRANF